MIEHVGTEIKKIQPRWDRDVQGLFRPWGGLHHCQTLCNGYQCQDRNRRV